MFFPTSIKDAKQQRKEKLTPSNINLTNEKCIHFTEQFEYLGSLISLELNEDAEIATHINKAKSLMGILCHFFSCQDVDLRTKYNKYVSCPLNALLWGCETWNLLAKNLKKLEAFHHGAARRILNIKWQQVHEDKIRNKQVRFRFCNAPKVETFILCRTAKYLGKVTRSSERTYPKNSLVLGYTNQKRMEESNSHAITPSQKPFQQSSPKKRI
jgi:hypothetical protein